jgi:hypothetical protein
VAELITPEELPRWVPGEITLDSAALGWEGVRLRGYRYAPLDVPVPAIREYLLVVYEKGVTPMNRRCTGDWRRERVAPGAISLMTHAAQSHWRWSEDIEVTHIYLSPAAVKDVAEQAFERQVRDVELFDLLKTEDPVLSGIAGCLAQEAREGELGGRLYVDSLKTSSVSTCCFAMPTYSSANLFLTGDCRALNTGCSPNMSMRTSIEPSCWPISPAWCSSVCSISCANSAANSAARHMPMSCGGVSTTQSASCRAVFARWARSPTRPARNKSERKKLWL